jgi:hypothetical protein
MNTVDAFFDELEKISEAKTEALKALATLKKNWKLPTAFLGGAGAYHLGGKALKRYQLGKQIEEQMEARGR